MKKVEWEELEHLGGNQDDIYVRMLDTFRIEEDEDSTGYEPGDFLRLQTRHGKVVFDDYYWVQNENHIAKQKKYCERRGVSDYDKHEHLDGDCAELREFEVVWNPLNIDIEDTVY